jgi:GalNAc-alpha-(1->4)-GalNAc-alpha-(1->3)-diNAcBac-PP-undecaprenol alpha-1,4-N-acetyl-D-galactosaminyltransferase
MTDKKKIFFVSSCLSMGGIERASVNTANGLNHHGVEVVFLSLFRKSHFYTLNAEINLLEPSGFNINSLNLLKSVSWIRSEIVKHKPTHVLVFNKLYGAIAALALVGLKIPLFISERSSPFFEWQFPFNCINSIAFKINHPKGIIAQTQIAADYQKKYYKKSKIEVIPNCVKEVKLYPHLRRESVILVVGRLNDYLKGLDMMIESFAFLKNQDWELHIAGGDENGESLKQQAEKLGIRNRVKFLGAVKDIDLYYAKAGIYVIPSRSEGFPNSLLEAMAAGCCCVAFDFIAGPRELINNGINGVIVENGNILELSKTLDYLILNKDYRISLEKEALMIREKYFLGNIINRIIDFLN